MEATPAKNNTGLKDGHLFDRFRIIKHLGSGGMGDVYLATDTERFIDVALKLLDRRLSNYKKLVKRFKFEAEIYQKLSHPNIVAIVAQGSFENYDYIALEHIRGKSLLNLLHETPILPLSEATSIMIDLIYALHAAHQRGVIHRDIKPHNIMITEIGTAKLIDFGIAKESSIISTESDDENEVVEIEGSPSNSGNTHGASTTGGNSTGTGHVVGTMAYSSPEQLQCQQIDGRSDIYCLGLVLYELLTGLRPTSGTTVSELLLSQSNMDSKLVAPSRIRNCIPSELDEFVLKMVRYSPSERHQSSLELIESVNSLSVFKTEEDNILATATRRQAESRNLASLELSDTHYWKAMEHFENKEFSKGMIEFDKLNTTINQLPKQLAKTMSAKLDHLFLTTYPIIPSIPGELPDAYLNDRIEYLDFIRLICQMVINYHKLSRPVSAAIAWLRLQIFVKNAKNDRPDVYELCVDIIHEFEDKKEWKSTLKYIETIETTEDKEAKKRETGSGAYREKTRSGSIPMTDCPATIVSNTMRHLMAEKYKYALEEVKSLLGHNRKNKNAVIMAALILEHYEIRIPSFVEENRVHIELYLLMGLFTLAGEEIKNQLQGNVSDLSVYEKIVDIYLRAGLEHELWSIYFKMASILLEQECHDEARIMMKKSLLLSHNSQEVIDGIKELKNVHRIFSISELSSLKKEYEAPEEENLANDF